MDTAERIADLKRKLKAREGRSEYKDNVTAIRAEIARLEALQEGESNGEVATD